jgi:hypothetical protein
MKLPIFVTNEFRKNIPEFGKQLARPFRWFGRLFQKEKTHEESTDRTGGA